MKHHYLLFVSCLVLSTMFSTFAFASEFLGTVNEPYPIYLKSTSAEGTPVAMGTNYALIDETIIILRQPEGANVSVDYTTDALEELCTKGIAPLTIQSDLPGIVEVKVILAFEEQSTKITKYISGQFEIDYQEDRQSEEKLIFFVDQSFAVHNDSFIQTGFPAVTTSSDGHNLVSLRAFSDLIMATISHDAIKQSIMIETLDKTIICPINEKRLIVNDDVIQTDFATYVDADGYARVPLEPIANAFGYDIAYTYQSTGEISAVILSK